VVQNIKVIVVIPNKNMCSRERNTDPLELREGVRRESLSVRAGNDQSEMESTRTHRRILIEMRYTARNVPKCRARWMIRHAWDKTSRGQAMGMGGVP